MGPGNVIRLRHFETVSESGTLRQGHTAAKGLVFVCVILGFEAQPFPPSMATPERYNAMLREMGWTYTPEKGA